jgi:hypothetical protein
MMIGHATSGIAGLAALLLLTWAVGLANTAVEPWGDSPPAFYALVADILLGLGTVLLLTAITLNRARIIGVRIGPRLERVIYGVSGVLVAIPILISANNSFQASSNGEGHPSLVLLLLAGVGLTTSLGLLMRRALWIGLVAATLLGSTLMAAAMITAPW